ncbi:MAG: insulinase family protein [Saprospiraceae bacterium]|nr:insulinase family protein [Saprospiraceae bacterium]
MKKLLFLTIALALGVLACTPKAGEKTTASVGKAPTIPMPTGNVRAKAPQAGPAPKIQIGKAETFTLENGLTVIVVENHKLPRVSYRLFVDYDPVLEKDAAGYSSLAGEMLTKGTKTRSKIQIDEEVDFMGASLGADQNGLSGRCLSKHSDKLLAIMSDVLLNPSFPAEEFDKVKTRTESGLASSKDDPDAISENVASVLRNSRNHPYGEVMTEETLQKITLDQVKGHYGTYFKPNISYLIIVGDITKAKAEQQAKKYFGGWAKGEVPTHKYPVPRAPETAQVAFVHKPGAVQSAIKITYPVELQPGTDDVIRARVMNTILGGGVYFNNRVNDNLREGHGWTYGAGTSLSPNELVGSFEAGASVRNSVTDSAVIEFMKEIERMRTEKVSNDELQVVKNVMTGQFSRSLEEPGTVADFALATARFKLPADYYERYLEVLNAVTPEEVLLMAKKYLRPDKAYILVVGNKDEVADRLKQFSPEKKVNFYDTYGYPVKETSPVPAGVTAQSVIENYINAIGGNAKINALKDAQTTAVMKGRGPEFVIKTFQKGGEKFAMEMTMNGQPISKQVYDGKGGIEYGMGGATRNIEGSELTDMKEQAAFCKEATYVSAGYKLDLKGMEEVNGSNAFVVEVTRPDGEKTTEYYDAKTSLKVREVRVEVGPDGQSTTVTSDFSDYKEVGGVLFPHTMILGGIFPVPMKASVTELKVNAGLDDKMFEVK